MIFNKCEKKYIIAVILQHDAMMETIKRLESMSLKSKKPKQNKKTKKLDSCSVIPKYFVKLNEFKKHMVGFIHKIQTRRFLLLNLN